MTDRDMPSGDVERVAAALEEAWKAADVDSTDQRWSLVWAPHLIRALSAMPDRQAGINEGLEMAAKVAKNFSQPLFCTTPGDAIAHAIRAMKVEK